MGWHPMIKWTLALAVRLESNPFVNTESIPGPEGVGF